MAHSASSGEPLSSTTSESRRGFLTTVSGLLSLLIAGVLATPLVGFVLAPVFKRQSNRWVKLGSTSDVREGEPTKLVYSFPTTDAWLSKVQRGTVYVETSDGNNYTAISNVCTHAGCGVRWEPSSQSFRCPCHNGRFDRNGRVIGGPPPHPLRRFPCKVERETIYVQLEEA